ncbi:helix-turn-helix domain-containing protein [Candidatus Uhrbacteria bacterium]|nr:helix-turn-helix domain-containing protein [Candidatus Uhrbacteria bacterium]
MLIKEKEKRQAILLRKRGKSYSEIQKVVGVSMSSISLWLRNVPLSKRQKDRLFRLKVRGAKNGGGKKKHLQRLYESKKIIRSAWDEFPKKISSPLFLLGVSLYWAEGSKADEKMSLSNSDHLMIECFMKWLREVCDVPEKKVRVHLHIHSLHSKKGIEKYWSRITHIPLNQFIKTYVKTTSLGHRKNILYNGTCTVNVHDVTLYRKMIGWQLGLLEYLNLISPSENEKNCIIDRIIKKRTMKQIASTLIVRP